MSFRRGISLIEILFSIGVVGIGLLGVLSLVPLAMRQVGQGNDFDRTARMGLNSLAEFTIRGMGKLENWRYYKTTAPIGFFPVPLIAPQNSVAIDPLALSLPANQNTSGTLFPATPAAPPPPAWGWMQMDRYSLRSVPQPLATAMSSVHADRLFILRDELIFNLSDDLTVPPTQVFNWDQGPDGQWGAATVDDDGNGTVDDGNEAGWNGSDDLVTTRQTDGVYSWMATLTPKLDTRNFSENIARDYILSIVVFRNRDFAVTNGIAERIVDVDQVYGDGTGGGDMLFKTIPGSSNPVEELQGIREGNWVLLSCRLPAFAGPGNVTHFSWYRVDSVEDEPALNGSEYELNVSLNGPDWPLGSTWKPAGPATTGTQAALFKNLIGVYQKVIHLETPSLWSD